MRFTIWPPPGLRRGAALLVRRQHQIRQHVDLVVREAVEQTLNGLLEAEADQLCRAGCYERSPDRLDTRAGHYHRQLQTQAGEVTLKVPRLRSLPFEIQIIERYRRRESSVEEALMEMYWRASPSVGSRTSPRPSAAPASAPAPSAS